MYNENQFFHRRYTVIEGVVTEVWGYSKITSKPEDPAFMRRHTRKDGVTEYLDCLAYRTLDDMEKAFKDNLTEHRTKFENYKKNFDRYLKFNLSIITKIKGLKTNEQTNNIEQF